jgi:hypothetical protein
MQLLVTYLHTISRKLVTPLMLLLSLVFISNISIASDISEQLMPRMPAGFLTTTYFKPSNIRNSDGVKFSQLDTHLKIPIAKTGDLEGGMIVYSFKLLEREIIIDDFENTFDNKQRLYDISVPITYINKEDDETSYIVSIAPGVKSSLEFVNTKDFSANAVAQVIKSYEHHGYQYGLVYTNAFGKERLVPLVAYRYKPNTHWDLTLGFPVTYASYAPKWGQNYFAKITPNGGSWHVYKDNNKSETFDYVQQGYRFGIGGQWKVAGPLWFEIESGLQFGQELRLEDQDSVVINAQFDNTSYIQLGFNIHFGGPAQK